jgi:hypothetical protein
MKNFQLNNLNNISDAITNLCINSQKPIILIIDEIDKSSLNIISYAVKVITEEKNTLFDDIIKNLDKYNKLDKFIYNMLFRIG